MKTQLSIFDIPTSEAPTTVPTLPTNTFSPEARRDCPSCYILLAESEEFLAVQSRITGTRYRLIRENGGLLPLRD